jgi:hypothetical protein
MKYSDIIRVPPLTVRPDTAERLFEAPQVFQDMVRAGWVQPCFKSNRCVLYLYKDLEKCAERLARGERPTP